MTLAHELLKLIEPDKARRIDGLDPLHAVAELRVALPILADSARKRLDAEPVYADRAEFMQSCLTKAVELFGKWNKGWGVDGAGYKDDCDNWQNYCCHCQFWAEGACQLVDGRIQPDATCSLFVSNPDADTSRYNYLMPGHVRKSTPKTTDMVWQEKRDAADPVRKVMAWNGLSIGITHPDGSRRYGLPLRGLSYGHIRRSYGTADDGKAQDVYVGPDTDCQDCFKIRQLTPDGLHDEYKYMIGFRDPIAARDAYLKHVPRARFGGIELVSPDELAAYRMDAAEPDTADLITTYTMRQASEGLDAWRSDLLAELDRLEESGEDLDIGAIYDKVDSEKLADPLANGMAVANLAGQSEAAGEISETSE